MRLGVTVKWGTTHARFTHIQHRRTRTCSERPTHTRHIFVRFCSTTASAECSDPSAARRVCRVEPWKAATLSTHFSNTPAREKEQRVSVCVYRWAGFSIDCSYCGFGATFTVTMEATGLCSFSMPVLLQLDLLQGHLKSCCGCQFASACGSPFPRCKHQHHCLSSQLIETQ